MSGLPDTLRGPPAPTEDDRPGGGFGVFLTTERSRVDLGTHHGRRLHGHARRTLLRVALGRRAGLRLALSRTRPTAVEVTEADRRYRLPIAPPPEPWLRAAGRLLLLWALTYEVAAFLRGGARGSAGQENAG